MSLFDGLLSLFDEVIDAYRSIIYPNAYDYLVRSGQMLVSLNPLIKLFTVLISSPILKD